MGRAIDLFVTYRFIKLLVTPFEKTDAYRLGIIDENGHRVMVTEPKRVGIVQRTAPKPLSTSEERAAYTVLHNLYSTSKEFLQKFLASELSWEPMLLLYFFSKTRSKNLWTTQIFLRNNL